jgi:hypothetical protein
MASGVKKRMPLISLRPPAVQPPVGAVICIGFLELEREAMVSFG